MTAMADVYLFPLCASSAMEVARIQAATGLRAFLTDRPERIALLPLPVPQLSLPFAESAGGSR